MANTKKSKRWSMKDIRKIASFIKDAGGNKDAGILAASIHFGTTKNAVYLRYNRYLNGVQVMKLKKNTTKVPLKRKKRKYTKSGKYNAKPLKFKEDTSPAAAALAKRLVAESNRIVLPVTLLNAQVPRIMEIIVDFDARSITYTY